MTERLEAVAIRKYEDRDGNEKSAFTNIGVAWPMKDRDGYTLRLHAMPAPTEGEFVILLMPPKPKEDNQRQQGRQRDERQQPRQQQNTRGFSRDLDDDITF